METVYISKSGTSYHRANCPHCGTVFAVPLEKAIQKGLKPCHYCNPPTLSEAPPPPQEPTPQEPAEQEHPQEEPIAELVEQDTQPEIVQIYKDGKLAPFSYDSVAQEYHISLVMPRKRFFGLIGGILAALVIVIAVIAIAFSGAKNSAYGRGHLAGEESGYATGFEAGKAEADQLQYDQGFEAGKTEVDEAQYTEGFEAGKAESDQAQYDAGYETGKAQSDQAQYDAGYEAGVAAAAEGTAASQEPAAPVSEAPETSVAATVTNSETVYVSSTGKIHRRSDCSGMKNYTEMTMDDALARGYVKCKKCY